MNIFILEDDIVQQKYLEMLIKQLNMKNNISCQQLYATAKPENLLAEIENTVGHRLYFLDIEIKNYPQKGLEIAQRIRKKDPYGTIVFVTTYSELATKTFSYKVSALDFIEKGQEQASFERKIEECILAANEYQKKPVYVDMFTFENKYTSFQIPFSNILYFETAKTPHKIRLVTATKTVDFYGKLDEVVTCDTRLFRCHKSFVVNLVNVISIDKKNKLLFFEDNISCFVSRRLLKETENKMKDIRV